MRDEPKERLRRRLYLDYSDILKRLGLNFAVAPYKPFLLKFHGNYSQIAYSTEIGSAFVCIEAVDLHYDKNKSILKNVEN